MTACAPGSPRSFEPSSAAPSASAAPPASALELLDCDAAPSQMGGTGPFGIVTPGDTPEAALAAWLNDPAFAVPRSGWEPLAAGADRSIFVFRNRDRVKAVAIISTRNSVESEGPFSLEELRACEEREFGAAADFGPGSRVWANAEGLIVRDRAGPEHCTWQEVRFLHIPEGDSFRQYLGDPLGLIPLPGGQEPFDADAELPADATSMGYRSGDLELWSVPDGSALFVVAPDHVERWPLLDPPIGCM